MLARPPNKRKSSNEDIEKSLSSTPSPSMRLLDKRWTILGFLSRNGGYIFFFLVFLIFMQSGLFASHHYHSLTSESTSSSWFTSSKPEPEWEHPITRLMDNAESNYRKKLQRQSKTLREAVIEYKRRYGRPPPKGFDEWWEFAKKYEVVMVDEYDAQIHDLEPFWSLSGEELRKRTSQVGQMPSINMVRVRKGKAKTVVLNHGFADSEVSARADGFRDMLKKFVKALPDIDFPINTKAESRVVIPWEDRNSSQPINSANFVPDWRGDGNVWEAWRRTCEPGSVARRLFSSVRQPFANQPKNYFAAANGSEPSAGVGDDFKFTPSTSYNTIDYCAHPHAHYTQGHFFSDWRTIPSLYPVFSPARAQGFSDIKIPSHYYWGSTNRYTYGWDPVNLQLKDVDDMEVPWDDKVDQVFWRGATTGGGSTPPGFQAQYQRHRFLRMSSVTTANNETREIVFADPPMSTTQYTAATVPLTELNEKIMDVAFVKATTAQTYPGGLKALMKDHRFSESVPLGAHWKYKYLLDMDGMGYSGRFMAFLASDSVPVKNTVYEEFFEGWIEPWVHFIPLSTRYREIYNIFSYFSGAPFSHLYTNSTDANSNSSSSHSSHSQNPFEYTPGQNRLRRIARAGKQWKRTMGRAVDMEVYVYRLALEWVRLSMDDRDAWSYDAV